jgi:hypothetical protein
MKTLFKIVLLSFLLTSSFTSFSQGKIDQSKAELKENSKRERTRSDNHSDSFISASGGDLGLMAAMAKAFLFVTYYTVIGDYEGENHLHSNLTKYPYYNHSSGNYENQDAELNFNKRGRIDIENLFLFGRNDFFGDHLKAKIRPFQYFYFQTDYFQLIEKSKTENVNSNLSICNFNVCYDRLRFDRFNFGWIVGVNYIGNDVQKAGFSYGLNTDIFLFKTLSLTSSYRWSSINGHPVNEFEIHLKHHINRFYITAGFEHLKIATPTYNFASAGAGIYF